MDPDSSFVLFFLASFLNTYANMKLYLLALLIVLSLCSGEVVDTVIVDVSNYTISPFVYRVAAIHAAIEAHMTDNVDKTILKLPGGTYTYCRGENSRGAICLCLFVVNCKAVHSLFLCKQSVCIFNLSYV